MKIAFQGEHGAYSDLAARAVFPEGETLPCVDFSAAMQAAIRGEAAYAMIPIDNSLAGRVADVHHLLPLIGLKIVGEYYLPVRHCLLAHPDSQDSDLTEVYSHVHALPQCRKVIQHYGLTPHVAGDTAGAARMVSVRGRKDFAAISSKLAAEIYGLRIVAENVQDEDHNTTRFLVLTLNGNTPSRAEDCLTTIVFRTRNLPAALYKALGGFATNGINLTKLESYMLDGQFEATQFYCDAEGHVEDAAMQRALEELGFFSSHLEVLGCYKRHRTP